MELLQMDVMSYGLTSAAAAGPVGILLLIAVIHFARRDAKRDEREREDRVQLTAALVQNTSALIESRKAQEETTKTLQDVKEQMGHVTHELTRRQS